MARLEEPSAAPVPSRSAREAGPNQTLPANPPAPADAPNAPTGEAGTSPISSLAPMVRRRRKNGRLRRFRW